MKKNYFAAALILLCAGIYILNYSIAHFVATKTNEHYEISEPADDFGDLYEYPGEHIPEPSTDFFTQEQTDASIKTPSPPMEPLNDYSKTIIVDDPETFFRCLAEARDRLIPRISLKLNNYSDEAYDIHKFERGKYSLSANGKSIGKTAYMTYTFEYSNNFAISRSCEDETLVSALTFDQQLTLKNLHEIKDSLIKEGMSDYEKELAIHDYIVKNYEYDTVSAEQEKISDSSADISCFLRDHKGVCEAYSYTFKALCDLCGIKCHVITGTLDGVSHAWNIVNIEGSYYHVDVTSDDPVPDIPQHCFYSFFNLTDAEIAKTHMFDYKWFDCSNDKYNYFKYNDYIVTNYNELYALTTRMLSQGYDTIVFKKQGFMLTKEDINDLFSGKGFSSYVITGNLQDPNSDHEITLSR